MLSLNRHDKLNLSNNTLTTIPDFMGNLYSFEKLFFFSNNLNELTAVIGNLHFLEEFNLSKDNIEKKDNQSR